MQILFFLFALEINEFIQTNVRKCLNTWTRNVSNKNTICNSLCFFLCSNELVIVPGVIVSSWTALYCLIKSLSKFMANFWCVLLVGQRLQINDASSARTMISFVVLKIVMIVERVKHLNYKIVKPFLVHLFHFIMK